MNYTTKQLQERYKSLPEDLKDAIWSAESAATIQSIGKKYGLNVEQTGKLASETGLVLLGLVHPKDYIKNLSGRASVDMDTARKIAEEVNNGIFSKVKENLKKLHGIGIGITKETPEKEQKPKDSMPTVPPSTTIPHIPAPPLKNPLELFQKHESEKYNQTTEQKQKPPAFPVPLKPELTSITPINLEKTAPKTSNANQVPLKPAESPAPAPQPIKPSIPITPHSDKKDLEPKPREPAKTPLIFAEKIKEEPLREQSQIIEIEKPNIPNAPKSYEKGNDPYKEPF